MSEAYVDLLHLTISPRRTSLILNLYHIRGSNSLSLHPSCCLMLSLLDGIFIEPLDKCVVISINILTSVEMTIEFMVRNTILAPRWFVISSMTSLTSCQHIPGRVWLFLTFRHNLGSVPLYLLRSSDPTLTRNTMLLLPRSMTMVLCISTRTLEAQC